VIDFCQSISGYSKTTVIILGCDGTRQAGVQHRSGRHFPECSRFCAKFDSGGNALLHCREARKIKRQRSKKADRTEKHLSIE